MLNIGIYTLNFPICFVKLFMKFRLVEQNLLGVYYIIPKRRLWSAMKLSHKVGSL